MVITLDSVGTQQKLSYRLIPTGDQGKTIYLDEEHPEAKVGVGNVELTESGTFRFVNPQMQWHKAKLNGTYTGNATLHEGDLFEPGDGVKYQIRVCEMGA